MHIYTKINTNILLKFTKTTFSTTKITSEINSGFIIA